MISFYLSDHFFRLNFNLSHQEGFELDFIPEVLVVDRDVYCMRGLISQIVEALIDCCEIGIVTILDAVIDDMGNDCSSLK